MKKPTTKTFALLLTLAVLLSAMPICSNWFATEAKAAENMLTNGDAAPVLTEGDATPDDDVTTPDDDVTTPDDDVTTPDDDVTTPDDDVTTPDDDVTTPDDDVTTPDDDVTTPDDDVTTPEADAAPEDTTKPGEDATTPEATDKPSAVLPTVPGGAVTDEAGKNSAPVVVGDGYIFEASEATDALIDGIKNADADVEVVEIYTKAEAPALTADVFKAAVENKKDVTIKVTNDANQVMYSWTFDCETLDLEKVTKPLNLTMSFATDKQDDIEKLMGDNDDLFISIDGYHGELPGPATVTTYVGNKYQNGAEVYLYYYNEEAGKIELIGNGPLVVASGYITYTLTHCSVYIVSETTPAELGIVVPEDTTTAPVAPTVTPNQNVETLSPKTSDDAQMILYIGILVVAVGVAYTMKKRARI